MSITINKGSSVTLEVTNGSPITPLSFWVFTNPAGTNTWNPVSQTPTFVASGATGAILIPAPPFTTGMKIGWFLTFFGTSNVLNQPYMASVDIQQGGANVLIPTWTTAGAFQGPSKSVKGSEDIA